MSKPRAMAKGHSRHKTKQSVWIYWLGFAVPGSPLVSHSEEAATTVEVIPDDQKGRYPIITLVEQTRNEFAGKLWAVNNWGQFQAMGMASNNDLSVASRESYIREIKVHGPTEEKTELRKYGFEKKVDDILKPGTFVRNKKDEDEDDDS